MYNNFFDASRTTFESYNNSCNICKVFYELRYTYNLEITYGIKWEFIRYIYITILQTYTL